MDEKKFTWVETHKQLVEIIRTKRDIFVAQSNIKKY